MWLGEDEYSFIIKHVVESYRRFSVEQLHLVVFINGAETAIQAKNYQELDAVNYADGKSRARWNVH